MVSRLSIGSRYIVDVLVQRGQWNIGWVFISEDVAWTEECGGSFVRTQCVKPYAAVPSLRNEQRGHNNANSVRGPSWMIGKPVLKLKYM